MRARIILTGLVLIAAACSRPAAVDETLDARNEDPDLALTPPSDLVPVASDVEVNRPDRPDESAPQNPTPLQPETPEPRPEPLAADIEGELDAASATAVAPTPMEAHVHPDDSGEALSGPAVEGGGKPTGISTGLGPVPDRNWGGSGGPGIIDDPNPAGGIVGSMPGIGHEGVAIIRGGAGGTHDDCKKHSPAIGVVTGNPMVPPGPAVLVNDRSPRRGALINDRAPRTTRSPSLPRGGGFIRGGIR